MAALLGIIDMPKTENTDQQNASSEENTNQPNTGGTEQQQASGERVVVRVLTEYNGVKPGGLASIEVKLAKSLVESGVADDNADAVDYAKSQGAEIVEL